MYLARGIIFDTVAKRANEKLTVVTAENKSKNRLQPEQVQEIPR
jgi:hypothetical protein